MLLKFYMHNITYNLYDKNKKQIDIYADQNVIHIER